VGLALWVQEMAMRKGEPVPPQKEVEYSSPLCSHHELFSLISTRKGSEAFIPFNE
jgi:hypothetical protein